MKSFFAWTAGLALGGVIAAPALAQDSLQNAGTASGAGSTAVVQSAAVAAALPVGSVAVGSVVVGASMVGGGSALAKSANAGDDFGTKPLVVDKPIILAQPAPVVPHDAQSAAGK